MADSNGPPAQVAGKSGRRRASTRPTIMDVARECGVAPSTVSRAFSHPGRVNPETAERIRQTAQRMGYRPNPIAKALPSGRTLMLALLVPDVTNPFFSEMIRGAERQAGAAGYTLVLADTDESPEMEAIHIDRLSRMVDGVIVGTSRLPNEQIAGFATRYPLVLVNREVGDVPSVAIDTPHGMTQAAEHLASLGHRSVAYLAGPRASWADRARWRALQAAGQRLGLAMTQLGPFAPTVAGGTAAAEAVVVSGATAVIAYNDLLAIGTSQRLFARGLHVPGDISVVGCDDVFGAEICHPALTTLSARIQDAGRAAVSLLLESLAPARRHARRRVVLPTTLVVRESTGSPPPEPSSHPTRAAGRR
ncbi:LacI family DNA-binding transcriptional regulator [Micromonospora sp. SL1-18]|uniref:LacI family DNA-binding transcriptional regulator n=1 Tax=Micromonospora sp. SL1-18 TaxID=3399128 RepID=UPI003A4E1D80